MFYPILENLRQNNIHKDVIVKLDNWLGTRRRAVWKSINPLKFSIDSGIDEEFATYLFMLCIPLEILKIQYTINCHFCDDNIEMYYSIKDIPKQIFCDLCNKYVDLSEEDIIISFELILCPQDFPYNKEFIDSFSTEGFAEKKDSSLRLSAIESDDVRRLMDKL